MDRILIVTIRAKGGGAEKIIEKLVSLDKEKFIWVNMEEFLNVLAESFLLPDDNGNCQAFFLLIRWFLGPAAENVLSKYGYAI